MRVDKSAQAMATAMLTAMTTITTITTTVTTMSTIMIITTTTMSTTITTTPTITDIRMRATAVMGRLLFIRMMPAKLWFKREQPLKLQTPL